MRFSERYGCEKPSDVIIRETITLEIKNAISNCFIDLLELLYPEKYRLLETKVKRHFFDQSLKGTPNLELFEGHPRFSSKPYSHIAIIPYLENDETPWWKILNLIEYTIEYLEEEQFESIKLEFIDSINSEFERLNFAYRIVDDCVAEITSEQEIKSIEKAIEENTDNVAMHLNEALKQYSNKENPDYRNSIKESISAVEAVSREITGENKMHFEKMKNKLKNVHPDLIYSIKKLYDYTNDKKTGIRHALMDETAEYTPGAEEALYMLVTCSAFINYLNSKLKIK